MSTQELVTSRSPLRAPSRLNPGSPLGYAELLVRGRIDRARGRVINGARDRGASVVEWVIISALVVGIAGAVSLILTRVLTTKANDVLNTGPATP